MKSNKKFVALIMALLIVVNFSIYGTLQVFAHDEMLDVTYDNCQADEGNDGIDELWYALSRDSICRHYSDESAVIKYYFEDTAENDPTRTWESYILENNYDNLENITNDMAENMVEEIKDAYANSMKKWNNVYFYSDGADGVVTKHKVIYVVEGTESDHNLSIYPASSIELGEKTIANAAPVEVDVEVIEEGSVAHKHYSEWKMNVNIDYFYEHWIYIADGNLVTNLADAKVIYYAMVNAVKEQTGAHELGHVLGLRDVDYQYENGNRLCNPVGNSDDANSEHHRELLMGYGNPLERRSSNITYKDIAGVAITRGFHTDNDHKWLNCGLQSDGTYKLICSICNGVKNVGSLYGYSYDTYNSCGGNHALASGNMMAVASYENRDYYKCKYCRYVAPFYSRVQQNYTKLQYSYYLHKCVNTVEGLEYAFYEGHTEECQECVPHNHEYTYTSYDSSTHTRICECLATIVESHQITTSPYNNDFHLDACACGYQRTLPHVVASTPAKMAPCLVCGATITIGSGTIMPWGNNDGSVETNALDNGIRYVTENGSYILPNGVIVLVSEDIEAYFNGELIFYDLKEQLEAS